MKKIAFLLFSAVAVFNLTAVRAQTVDELINKHIDAMGGKDKINSIKTIYKESTLEVMGNEAPTVYYIINGKGFKSETDFSGTKIITCVTDKGGWAVNPLMGQATPTAMSGNDLKGAQSQFQVGGPLLDYASKGNKVELVGREDVNGVSTYKIKVTTKDSSESLLFLDPNTYYVIKTSSKVNAGGQETETVLNFSDFRKTDFGVVMAFGLQIVLPQITLNVNDKKIEINKDIDPKIFDMPK
jgi:hypothetical protein